MTLPVVLLTGPTASGKSAVALALCERFGAEIVSVDSAQVYRGMDIGTAKPDAATRARVPHHLVDIRNPDERYSAADFVADAVPAIAQVRARHRLPLLVGGTMLYVKALLEGLSDLPRADPALRGAIDARAAVIGWPALHAELARIDPVTAARLASTDAQRIQRSLEVHALTGQPLSVLQGRRGVAALGDVVSLALVPERPGLHAAIAARFDAMLASGLVDELAGLRETHALTADLPSMRTVGYRQAWAYLEGEIDREALRERGIAATRQLAKRQYTWLRAMTVETFRAEDPHALDAICRRVEAACEAAAREGLADAARASQIRPRGAGA